MVNSQPTLWCPDFPPSYDSDYPKLSPKHFALILNKSKRLEKPLKLLRLYVADYENSLKKLGKLVDLYVLRRLSPLNTSRSLSNDIKEVSMKKKPSADRTSAQIMVVSPQGSTSGQIRQALKSIGYANVTSAPSHVQALNKSRVRNFTHVLFEAKATDMPTFEFVSQMMELDENCAMIALSEQPRIDDVFGLLRQGAKGFIVPPFTVETLENVLHQSTEGPPLNEAVLSSPDRNAAFTSVVLNNLYRLTVAMRQAKEFPTAQREVKIYSYSLRESVELAQLFCEGGDKELREKFIEGCLNRAQDAATRLGRLRKKLKKERVFDEDGNEITQNA